MASRQPHQMQINVEIPPDLDAVYSNLAIITHSASEVIIDFARILPNSPRARVYARVVTTPMHAKLLLRALSENLEQYEARFGEIKTFDSGDALAQQFFSAIRPPNQPDSG
jgi:hypothetical protein